MEKLARQTGPLSVFDASQKGDWDNTRNETVNGKPYRLKGTILEVLPQAGTLEIDYVSTSRPPFRSGQGAQAGRTHCMSTTTFCYMLKKIGLGDEEAWTGGDEADVVDAGGPPHAGDEKASNKEAGVEWSRVIDEAIRKACPANKTVCIASASETAICSAATTGIYCTLKTGKGRNSTGTKSNSSRSATGLSLTGMDLRATIGINTMACRLDELMADKWFSIDQVCSTYDETPSKEPQCEYQVDVYDYMTLVGCLEDLAQAFVIKRVGWLAAWNPCRPEGYMELSLDIREERQVAKVGLVGGRGKAARGWWEKLYALPTGGGRYDTPIPGWMLPVVWNTEEGLPHKGVLTCTHTSKAAGLRLNWILRTALAQVVSLSEAPPVSALIVGREDHSRTTGEGTKSDKNPTITEATEGTDQVAEDEPENVGIAGNRLDDLYGKFDREFVDSLCKQAGSDFFLYGAHERTD
ncbi:unnamed protein product [Ectocarpus sp. CCAP 1310/34]|nr:unnamed protein product [Ectocarpus sp. CCAP 1310/34]